MSADATARSTIALGPPGAAPPGGDPTRGRSVEGVRFGHAEVLAAIAALTFLVARFVPVVGVLPPCPFRAGLGIPCASCGMTRAFVALARGEVAAAVGASPLGAALAFAAWSFAALAVVRPVIKFRWPDPGPTAARAAALAGVGALLVNWGWLVVVGRLAP